MSQLGIEATDLNSSESILSLGYLVDSKSLAMKIKTLTPDFIHPFLLKFEGIGFLGVDLLSFILASIILVTILLFRSFITFLANSLLKFIMHKTNALYQESIVQNIDRPLRFGILIFGLYVFFNILFDGVKWLDVIFSTLFVGNVFWFIGAIVIASKDTIYYMVHKANPDFANEISGFVLKVLVFLVSIAGVLAILQLWGVNVTTLVASLGIGGLAVALAAKDTVANIFGSLALLFDKSVRIGEWVRVQNIEGHIEELGMRTTKIRTFDKALISIPNQVIANEFIENFGRRNIRRVRMNIGLTYSTTTDQIRSIRDAIEELLANHSDVAKDPWIVVRFEGFGASSLDIRIDYYLYLKVGLVPYLQTVETINLEIMEIVKANNASFAFPSQSLYIEQFPTNVLKANLQE